MRALPENRVGAIDGPGQRAWAVIGHKHPPGKGRHARFHTETSCGEAILGRRQFEDPHNVSERRGPLHIVIVIRE